MSVSEKVLDAIELLAHSTVQKAGYDKTIQAQILSCEDATIGKYRCKYQDSVFYAYSNSLEVTFSKGAYVYILIPNGDMSEEKTILGTTKKLGINYISQLVGDEAYNKIGNNCITSDNTFYLDSSIAEYSYQIYSASGSQLVDIDVDSLSRYIKESSSLIIGAVIKTQIPLIRQQRGHYGIKFDLRFVDNTHNKDVIRSYILDEDSMIDNPYRLAVPTRQYQIFNIDGENFKRIESIEIFCQDFPDSEGSSSELLTEGDITLTSLEIQGANRLNETEQNGVIISFYTPQGTLFTDQSTTDSYKTITAQVKVKGKIVSTANQAIPFYWGIEDMSVSRSSQYYNNVLKEGWKCLNNSNIIAEATETTEEVKEWVPGTDTYIIKISEATAYDNIIKVAAIYDNNVIVGKINIQNLIASSSITIESDAGVKFYYDIGHPTLTCKVSGEEHPEYTYKWGYVNDLGIITSLPETTEDNTAYAATLAELAQLKQDITNGVKFANAEAENLQDLENALAAYDYIQRVDANKIYDVQIRNITNTGIFKCSVSNESGVYLGTASIAITNSFERTDVYELIINNGTLVFPYNENGVASTNQSLDISQTLQPLSFTIYDQFGQPLDEEIVANPKNCSITWCFPNQDTMLVDTNEGATKSDENYTYYNDITSLSYNVLQKYDIKKQRNQIRLIVNYKDIILVAETNFTFVKQGDPGTNGTEYIVKLVPNTKMSNPPLWPMITKAGSQYFLNYGLNTWLDETEIFTDRGYQLFKIQLWRSGDLVWEGMDGDTAAQDGVTKPDKVTWEVLANKYSSIKQDISAFTITPNDGYIQYSGDFLFNNIDTPYANIIKCSITWQNKLYFGTIPITCAWTYNSDYRVALQDYSGWRYAIYTNDGMSPKYDSSHPFEFTIQRKIDDIWEDISLVDGEYAISYEVGEVGNYQSAKSDEEPINTHLIEVLTSDSYRAGCDKNQWRARPASRYNGECVNAAITCIYTQGENGIVGRINVPIHFLLNRYGLSYLNEWDGNSIQLDEDGGLILAPQMGAGSKEDDNSFTGVLMGETVIPEKSTSQIGLLGYNSGARTFFLNSRNGSALFGKSDQGQIIIDPSDTQKRAMIYSGNFWKNYNSDGEYDGLPSSYTYRNSNFKPSGNGAGAGLLIDLTTPEIYFGTGNFYVTQDGYIHAADGGDIAGWNIGTEEVVESDGTTTVHNMLYSNASSASGKLVLDAGQVDPDTGKTLGPGKIYSHSHNELNKGTTGFYLSEDGLSIGSKVKIDSDGKAYFGSGAVTGSGAHWTIDGSGNRSYIAYGAGSNPYWTEANVNSTTLPPSKVYLGTDGISLGRKFSVDDAGNLKAYSGEIGGWSIHSNYLNGGTLTLYNTGAINGNNWYITANGDAYFGKLSGQIVEGGTIIGNGITISGSTGGTQIDPTAIKSIVLETLGDSDTLASQMYNIYKQNFDNVYTVTPIQPLLINDDPIADGSSATILTWSITPGTNYFLIAQAMINLTTTATNAGDDSIVTLVWKLDGVTVETQTQNYKDGSHILTLDFLFNNVNDSPHIVELQMGITGGSIS